MSADNTTLADFQESAFDYTPLSFARGDAPDAVIEGELDAWQIDPSWLGSQPDEVEGDVSFHRYQFDRMFWYPIGGGPYRDEKTEIAPIEFRTYVNWVGDPPAALKEHIREHDNPRLVTLFDTGVYDGWMSGFEFLYHSGNTEDTEVAAGDVNNLGIPQWEVLVMDESGHRQGHAGGFFGPFGLFERAPQHERYSVTRNDARRSYEIRPQAAARQRLLGKRKEVTLDGEYIGNTVPTRGTIWLKMEYGTQDGTYKDSHSGRQMWSRRKLVGESGRTSPNGIRAGGVVWKTFEDADNIALVSKKPPGFDPTPPEEVDPDVAAELMFSDSTTFDIRHDGGTKLGKYTPPETRDITEERGPPFFGTEPR